MQFAVRHRHWVQFSATILIFVLSTGGLFGQVGTLLRESVHVCSCPADDGDHDCNCPHCAGPHVTVNDAPCHATGADDDEPDPPTTAIEQVPCGGFSGEASDLIFARAVLPARPVRPSLPSLVAALSPRQPPAMLSRGADAPEPPPPQRA